MISNIATAIMTKYNSASGAALRAVLDGGLWFTEADWTDGEPVFPYAVFTWNGSNIDEIAGDRTSAIEIASITMSLHSRNDDGGTEIFDLVQKFIELFDWTTLTYPAGEYSHLAVQRTSASNRGKIDNIWTIDLDYDIWYEH